MRTRTKTLLVTALAAAALCGGSFAQSEIASIDPEQQLRQRIAEVQAETGLARPAELADPLRSLAMLHQEAGDHALASAAFEEARYVARIHLGLASADEALLLMQQVRSERALGNYERVWNLEHDMVTLARQHHDDIRMLPIFRDVVDERLAVIDKVRAGERPPMIYAGCYGGEPLPPYDYTRGVGRRASSASAGEITNPCYGGTNSYLVGKLHRELLMYYADAIKVILGTGDYASPELRQLEKAAIHSAHLAGGAFLSARESDTSSVACYGGTLDHYLELEILSSCLTPVRRGANFVIANVGGRVGLVRLVAYEFKSGASAASRAAAIAELADWHVVAVPADRRRFSTFDELALAFYERAYRELQQDGDAAAAAQIFAPEVPVTLPTFEPNPFVSAATDSSRYIDVSFDITSYGTGEHVEILDASQGATRAETRALLRLIESTSFRPRVVDGKLSASAPVVVRYRLGP